MGAGVLECDATFTKDLSLVCRHSQCDLHRTTNVLLMPSLAKKCTKPFAPACNSNPASARCCRSDFSLAEFRMVHGKMDAVFSNASNVEEYMNLGTPSWRTDLYGTHYGTLMTHAESIGLFKALGVQMTPEVKKPNVKMLNKRTP